MPWAGWFQRTPLPAPAAFSVRQVVGAARMSLSQSGTRGRIGRDGSSRRITTIYSCRPGQVVPRRFGTPICPSLGCVMPWLVGSSGHPQPVPTAFIVRQVLGAVRMTLFQSGTRGRIRRDGSSRRITTSYSCRPGQVDPRRFGTAYLSQSGRRGCLGWLVPAATPRTGCAHRQPGLRRGTLEPVPVWDT